MLSKRQKRAVVSISLACISAGILALFNNNIEEFKKKQKVPPSKFQGKVSTSSKNLPTPVEIISENEDFVVSYDKRLRNPSWACIHLKKNNTNVQSEHADRSLSKFKPDDNIPDLFRTKPDDFKSSGFDRGHLIPAGDANNQSAMDETFKMSNISPQVGPGMNRGFWQMLEKFVRSMRNRYQDVFVCTGPLFLPEYDKNSKTWVVKYQVIGPKHDIAVPTHFFKCIHAVNDNSDAAEACFIVPNRTIDHKTEKLTDFQVNRTEVERLAGFELFPDSNAKKLLCDEIKCDLSRFFFTK